MVVIKTGGKKNKIMFDAFKQLSQLKQFRDAVSKEKAEVEKNGVKVVINGSMEIESVEISSELSKEEEAAAVKDAVNEAIKKIQKVIARKMQEQQ